MISPIVKSSELLTASYLISTRALSFNFSLKTLLSKTNVSSFDLCNVESSIPDFKKSGVFLGRFYSESLEILLDYSIYLVQPGILDFT